VALPRGLITGRTAKLPGDWKKQSIGRAGSDLEEGFFRLWKIKYPELPMPCREHRFHAERKWRLDFAWPKFMLAVEIDGGAYGGGRHQRREGFNRDAEKSRALAELGWRVLRFTGDDLRREPLQCIETVARVLGRML